MGHVQHAASFGDSYDQDGIGQAGRGERGPINRINREVHLRAVSIAHIGLDGDHGRFILFAFAQGRYAVHVDIGKGVGYAVPRRLIGGDLVAAAHPARGAKRGGLGDPRQLPSPGPRPHRVIVVQGASLPPQGFFVSVSHVEPKYTANREQSRRSGGSRYLGLRALGQLLTPDYKVVPFWRGHRCLP